jgi:Carboxypeptidase regulatory-like domain
MRYMLRAMRPFLAFSTAALLSLVAVSQNTATVVHGSVIRLDTREPLSGAAIALISEDSNRLIQRATSDANGRFEFRDVATGPYAIQAQLTGFFGPLSHGSSPGGVVARFTAGWQPVESLLGMLPGAALSGRVTDASGAPAPRSVVTAVNIAYRSGKRILTAVTNARADEEGRYRLFGLGAGDLFVYAGQRHDASHGK